MNDNQPKFYNDDGTEVNPDLMPLFWPDGDIFGTICILDNKIRKFDEVYQKLMCDYKQIIESDFEDIDKNISGTEK